MYKNDASEGCAALIVLVIWFVGVLISLGLIGLLVWALFKVLAFYGVI